MKYKSTECCIFILVFTPKPKLIVQLFGVTSSLFLTDETNTGDCHHQTKRALTALCDITKSRKNLRLNKQISRKMEQEKQMKRQILPTSLEVTTRQVFPSFFKLNSSPLLSLMTSVWKKPLDNLAIHIQFMRTLAQFKDEASESRLTAQRNKHKDKCINISQTGKRASRRTRESINYDCTCGEAHTQVVIGGATIRLGKEAQSHSGGSRRQKGFSLAKCKLRLTVNEAFSCVGELRAETFCTLFLLQEFNAQSPAVAPASLLAYDIKRFLISLVNSMLGLAIWTKKVHHDNFWHFFCDNDK